MIFTIRRLQQLRRASNVPLNTFSIDLQKDHEYVDWTFLWGMLTRFGLAQRMIKAIRVFHHGRQARVHPYGGEPSYSGSTSDRDQAEDAFRPRFCPASSVQEQHWLTWF